MDICWRNISHFVEHGYSRIDTFMWEGIETLLSACYLFCNLHVYIKISAEMNYIQLYSNLYTMEASHVFRWKGKEESSTGAQQMRGALIHPLAKAIAFKIRRGNHRSLYIHFRRKSQVHFLYKTIMWSSILQTIHTRFVWNSTHGGSWTKLSMPNYHFIVLSPPLPLW